MTDRTAEIVVEEYLTLADDSCVAVLPHVLRIAAELDLAGSLAAGPRTAGDIAGPLGVDADAVYRLLRALASVGMVREQPVRRFALTPRGERLRADAPDSVRHSVLNPDSPRAWLRAMDTVRTGRAVFDGGGSTTPDGGGGFFAHKDGDAQASRSFLGRMRERAARLYPSLVHAVDWAQCAAVMDIGGADGSQLDRILRHAPHLAGVLFDRPAVIDAVRGAGHLAHLGRRCRLHAGDFFAELPAGADTHLLCSVLHDWTDQQSLAILRNSRAALEPGGRLLIVEMLVPTDGSWHPSVWSDVGMMVLTGGRERTATEFGALLSDADFTVCSTRPVPNSPFSVLEAK